MDKIEKKTVIKGSFEDVIFDDNHYYIAHKLNKVCVLPYTLTSEGLLDKIGIIKEIDIANEKENYVLINGYINQDDNTNLVCANRLLYEAINLNAKSANDWMYLGKINNTTVNSNMVIYSVDITDLNMPTIVADEFTRKFELVDSNKVSSSDDALFLASYMRLFHYFYINSN